MKKKIIALVLGTVLLCSLFSGCDMFSSGRQSAAVPSRPVREETVKMSREGLFYVDSTVDSEIIGTFTNGTEVTITEKKDVDGVSWGYSYDGWVCLDETHTDFTQNEAEYIVNQSTADLKEGPGMDFNTKYTRQAGDRVHITRTTVNGQWGFTTDRGWIEMSKMSAYKEDPHYAVVREGGTYLCSKPGDTYYGSSAVNVGTRIQVQYSVDIGFDTWWYCSGRWVCDNDIYIEGQPGRNPATGVTTGSTPLNVRTGPNNGESRDKVGTIALGVTVTVMEQIDCGANGTWGYTGEGWIYMPLVKIE